MSASVEIQGSREVWKAPLAKALDEDVWQAQVGKGRAPDRRHGATRGNTVTWISLAGLLAAVAWWSDLTPYEGVARFLVAAGAIVLMFQTLHARRFAFAAVFGALALLYNPVTPVLSFSGDWHRALLVLSAVPLVATLAWRYISLGRHD